MSSQLTFKILQAKLAIRKVARCLNESSTGQPDQHLGNFLRNYILGIIAILNDILHDVQGRKTIEMKCKVLNGLSMLVQEVGVHVNAVAPQVWSLLFFLGKAEFIVEILDYGDLANIA